MNRRSLQVVITDSYVLLMHHHMKLPLGGIYLQALTAANDMMQRRFLSGSREL